MFRTPRAWSRSTSSCSAGVASSGVELWVALFSTIGPPVTCAVIVEVRGRVTHAGLLLILSSAKRQSAVCGRWMSACRPRADSGPESRSGRGKSPGFVEASRKLAGTLVTGLFRPETWVTVSDQTGVDRFESAGLIVEVAQIVVVLTENWIGSLFGTRFQSGEWTVRRRALVAFNAAGDSRVTWSEHAIRGTWTRDRGGAVEGSGDRWSADAAATLPRPEQAETLTMPSDDGFRFDDYECGSPSGPRSRDPRPEPPVRRHEAQPPRSRPIQHLKLVPQGEYLKLQSGARPKTTSDRQDQRDQDGNHRHEAYPGTPRTSMVATRTGFSASTGTRSGQTR